MQKKLIALVIASFVSGSSFAQSNVNISGVLALGLSSTKLSNLNPTRAASFSSANETRLDDQTSRIIFSGEESLGNGTSLYFLVATIFALDMGAGNGGIWANGPSRVGFKGPWGDISAGRDDIHYVAYTLGGIEQTEYWNGGSFQDTVNYNLLDNVAGQPIAFNTRANNIIKYETPKVSGFVGTFAYSPNPAGNEGQATAATSNGNYSSGSAYNAALRYANGPIQAVFSTWNYKVEGRPVGTITYANADQESTKVGFAYSFPMGLQVGFGWDKSTLKRVGAVGAQNDVSRTGWMLPIFYTFGANRLAFNYGRVSDLAGAPITNQTGARNLVLGETYSLSRRTSVGLWYSKLTNDKNSAVNLFASGSPAAGSAVMAGESVTQLYAGITHRF